MKKNELYHLLEQLAVQKPFLADEIEKMVLLVEFGIPELNRPSGDEVFRVKVHHWGCHRDR